MSLSTLIDTLDPDADLAQRHLWLMSLLQWVRGDASDPMDSVARVRRWLDAVESDPTAALRWRRWWQRFLLSVDLTPLLADFGFGPRAAFVSELSHRLRRKILPGTPETTDLGELFGLLLPERFDAHWIRALDSDTLRRLRTLLPPCADEEPAPSTADNHWQQSLLDALTFSIGQISAIGFASDIRIRMSEAARTARSFHALPAEGEALRLAVETEGAHSTAARDASERLIALLERCRADADSVYTHLDEHGISVGIVFRLRQLRERVLRVRQLLDCLLATEQAERATAALLADLVHMGQDSRSLRALVASSTQLTAAKVAERSAESGEHYITRDLTEYRQMVGKAVGGGALIGVTTWTKFGLYGLALSPFWGGFATGLNYAFFFVLVQLLHWTVATKQPAVTAPAMVAKLRDIRAPGAVRRFVDEVAHLLRSQMAAILGNVGAVVPVVVLISLALQLGTGSPMIDADKARHVLHDMHLLGPTALFAAFTGVLLFASSIVAGWAENWFVFHKLDSAIAHNPRFTGVLGLERAGRWARWLRQNVSGLTANTSLGFMLGIVPAVLGFFGLPLEVRHVTLSAGQVAAAATTLGWSVLTEPAFWWAVGGVVVVGPLNLAVSFYLAFRLALKAQALNDLHRSRLYAALRQRLRRAPLSFLWPPRPQDDQTVDELPPDEGGSAPSTPPPDERV